MKGVTATTPASTTAVIGIAVAAGLVPLNSTMIAVALPDIAASFGVSTGRVSVLVTAYLVAMFVGQPIAGRIIDRFGARTTVVAGLAGISMTSLLAAGAPALGVLVATRGLQAAFAATLVPGVQSMLRALSSPSERGRSFGILGSVIGVGAAAGPLIGGTVTQVAGWRAIFVVNVPIALAALLALRRVDAVRHAATTGETDATPPRHGIANRIFVSSFAAQTLSTQGQYALLLLAPMMLSARGWGAGAIGLALSAFTVGLVVTGPPGGRAGDTHGRRAPVMAGLAVATVALGAIATGGPDIDTTALVVALAAFGLGLGFSLPSLTTAALESVRDERAASAAGVFATSRYVGSITASLAIAVVVTDDVDGTRAVLAASTVAMVLAFVVAAWLPGREPTAVGPRRGVAVEPAGAGAGLGS